MIEYATLVRRGLLVLAVALLGRAAPAQVHYFSLDQQTLDVPGRAFYVGQVLDGRVDRAGIGQVRPKVGALLTAHLRPADLDPNLVAGLTGFLQNQLPLRPGDRLTLVLVRELRVSETETSSVPMPDVSGMPTTMGGGIVRRARATLDFYLYADDGYHFVQTATDSVHPLSFFNRAIDVTPLTSHEHNLGKVLERCLTQLARADWAAAQARPAQSLAALAQVGHVAAGGAGLDYAIVADSVRLTPGYYPTFLAFRNNQPVPVPTLHLRTTPRTGAGWENLPQVTPLATTEGKARELPEAWGFSDGQYLYLRHHGHYRRLARQGSAFGFSSTAESEQQALRSGDLLGAALADTRPVPYTLELLTGRITQFADAGRAATRTDTARIYVYRGAGPGPAQPLFLNDQPVGELAENQVLMLPWADAVHEPRLRLGTAPTPELAFIPDFRQPIYVRVARKPAPAAPPLELVPAQVGVFDLKRIKLRAGK
jgi:hypothetical protein